MATKPSAAPRERLLDAANKLFYEEGIHTVGIDRVIEKAGVAKASLYSAFGSKDELVRAYLAARHERRKQRVEEVLAKHRTPRARLVAVFEVLGAIVADPSFRGCAFLRASAEPADKRVRAVCDDTRAWLRSVFLELAESGGARDPERLVQQLVLLYDGATVGAQMDHDASAGAMAGELAATLFDAATKRR